MSDNTEPTGQRGLTWLRRYTWWFLVPYPFLAAGTGVIQALRHDHPQWLLTAILAGYAVAALVCARWLDAVTRDTAPPAPGLLDWLLFALASAGMAVTAWWAAPFGYRPLGWLLMAGGLVVAMCLRLPSRWRLTGLTLQLVAVTGFCAALASAGLIGPGGVITAVVLVASLSTIIWVQWWAFDVARQLERARRLTAELAVARERLRFAAELHDIQGHHLQVIALKSELAARLNAKRPEAATALMREVQGLAHDALRDTREVVAGYRRMSVRGEITNATRVLGAAGIDASAALPPGEPRWRPEVERELGLLVREATTNLLRHATPSRAEFALTATDTAVALRVHNDGAEAAGGGGVDSTGLTGLRDRFTAAGGSLDWRQVDGEFTVSARLPLEAGGAA